MTLNEMSIDTKQQSTKSSNFDSDFEDNDFLNAFQTELYPHQQLALEAINDNDEGIISSFCGTGKSRIMIEYILNQFSQIDEDYPQHVIVFFPSLLLLNQFYEKYVESQQLNVIQICSESKAKLTAKWFNQSQTLTLITYQSINKIIKFKDHYSIALFDEAHHVCTGPRLKVIQQLNSKRFYFTATPRQTKYLDMFNSEQSQDFSTGGLIFEYNFTNALEDQVVCDYQLLFRLYKDPNPAENKELKQLYAIINLAQENGRKRLIVFNQYIQASKFNKTNCKNFQLIDQNIQVVSGQTSKQKKAEIFSWFQDDDQDIKIICNVACIKEGIDLPCVDMVVFCDEKQSKVQIIQALGRGTRKFALKSDCLVAALIDYQNEVEELTHFDDVNIKGKFKTVEFICKALKQVDLRIEDVMQGKPSSLKFSIQTDRQSSALKMDDQSYIDQIKVALSRHLDPELRWTQNLDQCIQFKGTENNYPSMRAKDPVEKRLGQWLGAQKAALKGQGKGKMTEDRRIKLKEYLADFYSQPSWDYIWIQTLDQCIQFKKDENKYPSEEAKASTEKRLGQWLSSQKMALKGKGYMTEGRRLKLEEYLADFYSQPSQDDIWAQMLDQCTQFKQAKNKFPSSITKEPAEKRLGKWLSHQKAALKGTANGYKMTEDRRLKLEEYLTDQPSQDDIWASMLEQCIQFKNAENKYPSAMAKDPVEKRLGSWLSHQKQALQGKGNGLKMTEDRRIKLEEYLADFYSQPSQDDIWASMLGQCTQFKQAKNKYPADSAKDPIEKCLGSWLSHQKQALKGKGQGKMTENRRTKLEDYLTDFYNKTKPRTKIIANPIAYKPKEKDIVNQNKHDIAAQQKNQSLRVKPLLSALHQKYKTFNSQNLNAKFRENPMLWKEYHQIAALNEQGFIDQDNVPYKIIISYLQQLKFKRQKLVVDLGCGLNRIKEALQQDTKFQFVSFDHIAVDESVQECDISNLPLEDDSVNIAILCLAMWGSNCLDYINEAYRVLERGGVLLLIEPAKRWINQQENNRLIIACEDIGFKTKIISENKFIFIEAVKHYS